jgi:hypothetical protein
VEGSNPFATRFIKPGAVDYVLPPGTTPESLVAELQQHHWRGSIIGPHGSGKSSLLTALRPALERAGRHIVQQQLQAGQRSLDWSALAWREWTNKTLVIIDGYEQLSLWQCLLLRARCRQRGAGLLVTAHQPVRLPILLQTKPSLELALAIVQRLLPESDDRITPADVAEAYVRTSGNLREMLLSLFDVYRART